MPEIPDSDYRLDGKTYRMMWVEEDRSDHVLMRSTDEEPWCSIAQAHYDDGILITHGAPLPWSIIAELMDRQLARGGFKATVTGPHW